MKKILLTLAVVTMLLSAKAQYHNTKIIITGVMADPTGTDAHLTSSTNKGYEYAQFRATEYIDFSLTPYSIVFLYETTTTALPDNSWASGSQGLTYKFNLTSGIVNKGDFFYVGGEGKLINGGGTLDISETAVIVANRAKWIRSFDYAKENEDGNNVTDNNTGTAVGKTTLLGNSNRANAVAVFEGTAVGSLTEPKDVVFYGETGANHYSATPTEKGFLITNNDLYNKTNGDFFNKAGTNNATVVVTAAAYATAFLKFGGVYDLDSKTWITPRSATVVAAANLTSLAAIETGGGTTVLPVSLITFTAKANKQGAVNLAWSTASEKDNSHFEVARSANGIDFERLDDVKGNGNSNVVRNYSFTDTKPVVGVNYYRLKQVDFDGDFAFSNVATAKVGLAGDKLTVSVSANRSSVSVSYTAATNGKALFNIYNVSGAKIATVEQTVNVGANQINIPVNLGNVIHVLNVTQAGASASTKF
ncbi:MAG: hypothetical protein REI64_10875 [Pedobacter sp.]|uniref:hypothetical protein n=1 Tax=Pedobacter sp. TaxID=1411316 RepID=UPI002808B552|nr:hypothetical protein [Pedobacter sp.]MDQ8005294.1 hypothetical protein [Pedobacter sp.]